MNAAGRLSLYVAVVAVVFAGAFGGAAAVVPSSTVEAWTKSSTSERNNMESMDHGANSGSAMPAGVSLFADGYALSTVAAPTKVGEQGELSFRILDSVGEPLRKFVSSHEKKLHLITVRPDGTQFVHTHPRFDETTGTWSAPWQWNAAGSYRVYADFVPDVKGGPDKVTLTRTVDVAGDFTPTPATGIKTTDRVGGFDLRVEGQLVAGTTKDLTITVSRDGKPVTGLQPYLGAFGHLVALRDGDLAYLHVHAVGADPKPGDTAGPTITFGAEAPTAGRYLLYLDFQVDGMVHTAEFVLDASTNDGAANSTHSGSGGH